MQHLDYGARHYDPFLGSWTTPDPMAEKYYGWSPYNFCADDPVMYYDIIGMRPIYNREGRFLGTDDNGLQGEPIVLEDACFTQGMSAAAAEQYNLGLESLLNSHARLRLRFNQNLLKTRPDYDGIVTIVEGVIWAHLHPYALKAPSPKNTLYINTALLDFGHPDISNEEWMDLLNFDNFISSFTNRKLRSTFYALGHVKIDIINELDGIIMINNEEGSGTDYDWNLGGLKIRIIH